MFAGFSGPTDPFSETTAGSRTVVAAPSIELLAGGVKGEEPLRWRRLGTVEG